ncbi:MAG: zinc ribbon domain-containing protein [Candidatus Asgardarchaeia archaeon]
MNKKVILSAVIFIPLLILVEFLILPDVFLAPLITYLSMGDYMSFFANVITYCLQSLEPLTAITLSAWAISSLVLGLINRSSKNSLIIYLVNLLVLIVVKTYFEGFEISFLMNQEFLVSLTMIVFVSFISMVIGVNILPVSEGEVQERPSGIQPYLSKKCPHCGSSIAKSATYCPYCGKKVEV